MDQNISLKDLLKITGPPVLLMIAVLAFIVAVSFWKPKPDQVEGSYSIQALGKAYKKNVYVLIYNPTLSDGQKLSTHQGWNDPDDLAAQYIAWLKTTTNNKVNYTVVIRNEINDFPTFTDGRKYNETTYLACMNNTANCLRDTSGNWPMMNYTSTLNALGVCNDFNAGTIDELWMFGAPYMGWWEANQAGTNAFSTNGPVIYGTACNKPMNIMGFSYERSLSEMVEDLMHRIEGTMSMTYGSWAENSMAHTWDKYGLVAYQSPNYNYSGCGSCHYAPNSTSDYQWNSTTPVTTYCDEFFNYPDPVNTSNRKTVTCADWGCTSLGYFRWWLQRFPSRNGVAPDNKYADWWKYVLEPNSVYDVLTYVPTATPTPTHTLTPTPAPTRAPSGTPGVTATMTPTPVRSTTPPPATITPSISITPSVTISYISGTPTETTVTPSVKLDQLAQSDSNITIPEARDVWLSIALFIVSGTFFAGGIALLVEFFKTSSQLP